jgi:hypothetical protein
MTGSGGLGDVCGRACAQGTKMLSQICFRLRCDERAKTLADPSAGRRDRCSETARQKAEASYEPFEHPSEIVVCAQSRV